ncbi:MAG: hypothetical protein JHC95_00080 [Solirubrobacteraceae bacterium]|nr:hypothetical protein [Solirubrobacteraceae bacterium]
MPVRAALAVLALLLTLPAGAPAAKKPKPSMTLGTGVTMPATVVSGAPLKVKVTLTNRTSRTGIATRAEIALVGARSRTVRLGRVVVPAIKPDASKRVTLAVPVPPVGAEGDWRVRVCADITGQLASKRRGACRTFDKPKLVVTARPAPTAGAGLAPLPGPVAGPGSAPTTPGPVLPGPTPPSPPGPDWKLEITPNPLVLGSIPAGDDGTEAELSERPFTLTNTGTAKAPPGAQVQPLAPGFSVQHDFTCPGGTQDGLDPGESCTGTMSWSPGGGASAKDLVGRIAILIPATSGPLAYTEVGSVPVSANLVSRVWVSNSDRTVNLPVDGREIEFVVTNDGNVAGAITLSTPQLSFGITPDTCGAAVAPDETCKIYRRACANPGVTTNTTSQYFASGSVASAVSALTVKVHADTTTSC